MNKNLRMMICTAIFTALTAVGAFIQIPLGILSFTLQVFFACLAGVLLGAKWGAISQALYVFIGLIGVPIFTKGGGVSYLVQASMGFLFGLIPMAFVVGLITKNAFKKKSWPLILAVALIAGEVVLYAIGVPYPVSVMVDTFGTGKVDEAAISKAVTEVFDCSPAGIIKTLDLKKPVYQATAAYGHFGRSEFAWEKLNKLEELKKAIK